MDIVNPKSGHDVIILGSGMAGLSAALACHEKGLRPIVIEKAKNIGGCTAYSWGVLWVANNQLMSDAGLSDTQSDISNYMEFVAGGEAVSESLNAFSDSAPDALQFLQSCGIPFRLIRGLPDHYSGIAPGGRSEGRCVEVELVSGKELGKWQDRVRAPALVPAFVTTEETISWGGPNHVGNWDQSLIQERQAADFRGKGYGLVTHLLKALLDRKVPIVTGEAVQRLLFDGNRVQGVVTSRGEKMHAGVGVVLATGGYESSQELVDTFEKIPGWLSYAPPEVTGDGLLFAAELGGSLHHIRNNMELFLGFQIPDRRFHGEIPVHLVGISELFSPHTMVVNARGQRFGDESHFQMLIPALRHFDPLTHSFSNLPCYLIFDEDYASRYGFAGAPASASIPDWVERADDPVTLAKKLGIDPAGLSETVQRFNGFVAAGKDNDFQRGELTWRLGKSDRPDGTNPSLGSVANPPYYGLELWPCGSSSIGLLTNAHGQVLHNRRYPIPGLYSTGNTASNTVFGTGYQAGYTLSAAMTFSYRAAEHLASSV